ncbi:hypothetical protein EVAR_96060_1 [Eumeta japonica]|uniref:Uncharacterized protein n=1 Tax=Eumeta variegata TaxID=151549 RepID=A0A4C1WAD8_EUMVA|nr:hypothetical protein EVAR_96060_1 [Eumeta japonica]
MSPIVIDAPPFASVLILHHISGHLIDVFLFARIMPLGHVRAPPSRRDILKRIGRPVIDHRRVHLRPTVSRPTPGHL